MTPVSHGKPCAGNPHARFEEGASASEKPRRSALLHKNAAEVWAGDITPGHTLASLIAALRPPTIGVARGDSRHRGTAVGESHDFGVAGLSARTKEGK